MNTTKSYLTAKLLLALLIATAAHGQSTFKVRATTMEPAQQAAYIFELSFDSDVSPTSQIEILFPIAFNLNNAVLAASDKIDGMLKAQAVKSSLVIKRVQAQKAIKAGEVVDIKVASILNPNVMDQNWSFKVIVRDGQRELGQKVLSTKIEQFTKANR